MALAVKYKFQAVGIWFVLGISWGASYVIARFVTLHGVSPIAFSLYLAIGPALILFLYLLSRGLLSQFRLCDWRFHLISGLLGVVIPNTTMYIVASHMPASLLAMVVNISPIIVYPLALLLNEERFQWRRFLGVCCGLLALFVITLPATELKDFAAFHWFLIALISPISFALLTVFIAKAHPKGVDTVVLSFGMVFVAAIFLLPIIILFSRGSLHLSVTHLANWLVLLQILLSAIGTVLLFYLIKIAGPVFFSLVSCLVVIAGVIWGHLIFAEPISIMLFLAMGLVIAAIVLVSGLI